MNDKKKKVRKKTDDWGRFMTPDVKKAYELSDKYLEKKKKRDIKEDRKEDLKEKVKKEKKNEEKVEKREIKEEREKSFPTFAVFLIVILIYAICLKGLYLAGILFKSPDGITFLFLVTGCFTGLVFSLDYFFKKGLKFWRIFVSVRFALFIVLLYAVSVLFVKGIIPMEYYPFDPAVISSLIDSVKGFFASLIDKF